MLRSCLLFFLMKAARARIPSKGAALGMDVFILAAPLVCLLVLAAALGASWGTLGR